MEWRALGLLMRRLAVIGGAETLRYFGDADLSVTAKDDDSPVTAADHAADAAIVAGLAAGAPDIAIVTEERAETHLAAAPERFFLVDPLDGTKEFVSGSGEFTVNIALTERGVPVMGAVYAPAKQRLFWTPEPGLTVEETGEIAADVVGVTEQCRVRAASASALTVVASKSHRDAQTNRYIEARPVEALVSAGSSLKFCLIAAGEADLYPRFGRTMEWDTAAAHAVLAAAGGMVVRAEDGAALSYGKPGYENPHFIAAGAGLDRAALLGA